MSIYTKELRNHVHRRVKHLFGFIQSNTYYLLIDWFFSKYLLLSLFTRFVFISYKGSTMLLNAIKITYVLF